MGSQVQRHQAVNTQLLVVAGERGYGTYGIALQPWRAIMHPGTNYRNRLVCVGRHLGAGPLFCQHGGLIS